MTQISNTQVEKITDAVTKTLEGNNTQFAMIIFNPEELYKKGVFNFDSISDATNENIIVALKYYLRTEEDFKKRNQK